VKTNTMVWVSIVFAILAFLLAVTIGTRVIPKIFEGLDKVSVSTSKSE